MDYFIEDIGNISINNGLVRIDCVRRLPGENEGEVQLQNKGQVVLPLASFVRVQGALTRATEEMVSRGILQRREAAEQAPATDEEVTAALESFEVDLDEDEDSGADAEGESAGEKPKSSRRRSK